jgi:hypothetical protein
MVANGAFTRTNGFGAGSGGATVYPRFYMESVEDPVASQENGRAIFRDEERVEIIMAGNTHTRPVRRVSDEDRQRWPQEYEKFKQGIEMSVDGTPLEEWPRLRKAQVLELKSLGFLTVEQVRDMPDNVMQRIGMGGMALRDLARAYLDDADRNALVEKTVAENARKDSELAALRAQVANLGEITERLQSQLLGLQNQPHPLATHIPGMTDPLEAMRQAQPQPAAAQSSLANLAPRRPGRPRNPVLAQPDLVGGGGGS